MKIQHGYTLLELMIVVVIIGILSGIGIYNFSNIESEKYYAERCTNKIYGEISTFIYYASTNKSIKTQNTNKDFISPTQYIIKTVDNNGEQNINLQYSHNNTEEEYKTFNLKNIEFCQKKGKYNINLSGNIKEITMLPSFKSTNTQRGFGIIDKNDTDIFTGTIDLQFCPKVKGTTICKDFSRMIFDSRIGSIKKSYCRYYKPDDKDDKICEIWSSL